MSQIDKILRSRGIPSMKEQQSMNHAKGFISTGFEGLDKIICPDTSIYGVEGYGGFPLEKISEVAGQFGTGKSLLMRSVARGLGDKALYIDAEDSLTGDFNFDVVHENIFENIWGVVNDCLDSGLYRLIVVDSLSVATPNKELDADSDPTMNVNMERARLSTVWSRQLINKLRGSNTAIVFINHLKKTPDLFGGEKTTGGSAMDYAASLKLYLYCGNSKIKKALVDGQKTAVSQKVRVKVAKNRFGARLGETDIVLDYAQML